jgi:hypothetical protein
MGQQAKSVAVRVPTPCRPTWEKVKADLGVSLENIHTRIFHPRRKLPTVWLYTNYQKNISNSLGVKFCEFSSVRSALNKSMKSRRLRLISSIHRPVITPHVIWDWENKVSTSLGNKTDAEDLAVAYQKVLTRQLVTERVYRFSIGGLFHRERATSVKSAWTIYVLYSR